MSYNNVTTYFLTTLDERTIEVECFRDACWKRVNSKVDEILREEIGLNLVKVQIIYQLTMRRFFKS